MGQLPMDTIHLAMDMPHLLLRDTVLATLHQLLICIEIILMKNYIHDFSKK